MGDGIYSALSGAIAQTVSLETTATNLANSTTAGYRAIRPVFREVLAEQENRGQPTRFSAVRRSSVDTTPGAFRDTGGRLDIALPPNAFKAVDTPAGERYTRAGALQITRDGLLTTKQGEAVLSETRRRINVDPDAEVNITESGEVRIRQNDDMREDESVGFLRVVTFENPGQMSYEGGTLLSANREAGAPVPNTAPIETGKLEQSNASPVRAMSDLMMATRMFDAMERAISTFNAINRNLVSRVPKG